MSDLQISEDIIGKGTFGTVYLGIKSEESVAVKCCKTNKLGIPNLFEIAIMSSILHPHLNSAIEISAESDNLKIVQELAITDLSPKKFVCEPQNLRKILFSIVDAVNVLHSLGIIHGDIKANNILLYKSGVVKLSDFSLSVFKQTEHIKFTGGIGTPTHCAPECLLQEEWNESIDIWALGCTFFEIAYGKLLFQHQPDPKLTYIDAVKSNIFTRLRKRHLNVLHDWNESVLYNTFNAKRRTLPKFPISYSALTIPENFGDSKLDQLIISMLNINSDFRPKITEIINHEYFEGLVITSPLIIIKESKQITSHERARFTRYLTKDTDIVNSKVKDCAISIYKTLQACTDISRADKMKSENIKIIACGWIASKLIIGITPKCSLPLHHILAEEREICQKIGYSLISVLRK